MTFIRSLIMLVIGLLLWGYSQTITEYDSSARAAGSAVLKRLAWFISLPLIIGGALGVFLGAIELAGVELLPDYSSRK